MRAWKPRTIRRWPRTGKPSFPPFRRSRTIWRLCVISPKKRSNRRKPSAAQQSLALELDRYKAGTDSYLSVITTQTIALGDAQTAVTILQRRMTAAIDLIKALGGGWDASTLPSGDAIRSVAMASAANTKNVAQPAGK